jgi:hypothetical protein
MAFDPAGLIKGLSIECGASRRVSLVGAYALKFPRRDTPKIEREGRDANQREFERWSEATEEVGRRAMCRVLYASPSFDLVVMPRVAAILAQDWDARKAYALSAQHSTNQDSHRSDGPD